MRSSLRSMFAWTNVWFSFLITILLLAILSGCSSTQQAVIDRSVSASDIVESVNAQADSIRTFSAYGTLTIETPTMSQNAGFDLAVKKPDSLRIIVEGPFGITVGKALFTKHQFIAYNALNNSVYEGDPSQGMNSLPMMSSFPPEVLIDAFSGVRRFNTMSSEPDSFSVTEKFYTIIISENETISKFQIDPNSMRISTVKTFKTNGELLFEESYSYRQIENGHWVPSASRIFVPQKSITLDISFDEITINGSIGSMLISIPDDAERRTIN